LGCSTLKTTKRWYKDYINPTPKVDLAIQSEHECAPKGFATSFVPVDAQLNLLGRELSTQDIYPEDAWFDAFLIKYPWIDRIVAVNVQGEILASRNTDFAPDDNAIDYVSLCEGDPEKRMPKAHVLDGASGKTVCLSMPFFKGNAWKGCLIAMFRFERVVGFAPSPEDLIIVDARGDFLWAGGYERIIAEVADRPWNDLLEDHVSGEFGIQEKRFFWLGRSFAGRWLIYTSEIREQ
jgi:hypothetical protein